MRISPGMLGSLQGILVVVHDRDSDGLKPQCRRLQQLRHHITIAKTSTITRTEGMASSARRQAEGASKVGCCHGNGGLRDAIFESVGGDKK